MVLTREQILAAADLPRTEFHVEAWGGSVFLRPLTLGEALALGTADSDVPLSLRIVVMTAVNEKGERLFTEEDIPALKQANAAAVTGLFKAALALNGMGRDS